MLATGSMSHGARLWNAATGQAIATFPAEDENVQGVAFSSDAQTLVAVTYSGFVVRLDIATGRTRTLLRARGGHCSVLTPDARFLALADVDSVVKLWDLGKLTAECRNRAFENLEPGEGAVPRWADENRG